MMDKDRILILDGAMGTAIQRYGLGGNSEALNLSHPEVIAAIHREYEMYERSKTEQISAIPDVSRIYCGEEGTGYWI